MEQIKDQCLFPSFAIGTWGWGSGINGSDMIFGKTVTQEVLQSVYKMAVSSELTLFDTAAVYGNGEAEKILGNFSEGNSHVLLSSKYTPMKYEKSGRLEKSLEASLERLKRKKIDIFWLHMPQNIETNIKKMIELLKQGKIEYIGLSNANLKQIQLADRVLKKAGYKLFGVQNHYSLLYRCSEQAGIIDWCQNNECKFFSYMVLEQGVLTGADKFPVLSRRGMAFPKSRLKKLVPLIETMKMIGEKYNAKPAQIAIAHAKSKGFIPIIGVTKPDQAKQLVDTAEIMLTAEEIKLLEEKADQTGVSVKALWEKRII